MIFTADDYDYIPPELEDEIFDSSDETEDDDEMSHADMPHPKWTWGPNGENSPEYNAWYWDHNKPEIMARREELKRERGEGGTPDDESNDLRKANEEILNKNNATLAERRNARLSVERQILDERGALSRRATNKPTRGWSKGKTDKKDEEEEKPSPGTSSSQNKESDEKKKGSGGSGGGSGKKSSGSGKKKSGGSGGGSGKKSGGGSSGGKSSGSKSSDKEKSEKAASEKAEKETKETKEDKVDRMIDTHDSSQTKTLEENFKKIALESRGGEDSPEENYEEFIKALINNGYREVTKEEGLFLWEEYKAFLGINDMEKKENEKLQHGINVFEEALEHHGILGMKWGVQNGPPYPLDYESHNKAEQKAGWEKSLSEASQKAVARARKAYETAKPVAKKAGASVVKAGKATVEKAKVRKQAKREAAEERARNEYQKNRENAIKEGNSKYAREHFRELSNDEVNELLGRLDLSKKIDKANNVKTMADKIDDFMDNVTRVKNWTDKGSNAWNSFARLYNTMNGEDPLPVIGEDFNKTLRAIKKEKEDRAKEISDKARKQWFDSVTKDPDSIVENFNKFDNNEAKIALQRYKDNLGLNNEIDSSKQNQLLRDILVDPSKATAENLSKLDSNHVQSYLNITQNIDKATQDNSYIDNLLKTSPTDRSKINISDWSSSKQKRAFEALQTENNLQKAMRGEFGKTSTESAATVADRLADGLSNAEIEDRLSKVGYSDEFIKKVVSEYNG